MSQILLLDPAQVNVRITLLLSDWTIPQKVKKLLTGLWFAYNNPNRIPPEWKKIAAQHISATPIIFSLEICNGCDRILPADCVWPYGICLCCSNKRQLETIDSAFLRRQKIVYLSVANDERVAHDQVATILWWFVTHFKHHQPAAAAKWRITFPLSIRRKRMIDIIITSPCHAHS